MRTCEEDRQVDVKLREYDLAFERWMHGSNVDARQIARSECGWIKTELAGLGIRVEKIRPTSVREGLAR
jgi:hypothetical protein